MRYRNPVLAALLVLAMGLTACAPMPGLVANNSAGFQTLAPKFTLLEGRVSQLLPDDLKGSRHQLFRFETPKGVVQVAHNIDLAPYVPLKVGDRVTVKGEFINEKPYPILHWSHHDPKGGAGGYIEHQGKRYE